MYSKVCNLDINKSVKKYLLCVINIFKNNDIQAWLVGGCVRDLLLGREPKDYDLCFAAPVKTAVKLFSTYKNIEVILTGLKHGTITLHIKNTNYNFECTMLRAEKKYSDGRHPDSVTFTPSLEEDLKRRDLTINSFAYDLLTQEVVMLNESFLKDLEYGIIRTVGNPEDRFNEDALRMLRAIRFAAQLDFTIEAETFKAIKLIAPKLELVSKERIRDELTKILMSDRPEMLEMLIHSGLETYIPLPLSSLLASKQNNKYHYTDVLHHTFDVIKKTPKDVELRFAALFHDFGKPDKETTDENGFNHYYEHEELSATLATDYMKILKFDNDTIEHIHTLILHHNRPLDTRPSAFRRLVKDVGIDLFPKYLKLREADGMSHNLIGEVPDVIKTISLSKERYIEMLKNKDVISIKDLAINGYDIMELGFKEKEIGEALNKCLECVIENPELNAKETLLKLIRNKI